MAWPTKAEIAARQTAKANPREDDVQEFLEQIGTLEMEERPYQPRVLAGTEAIPEDIADAVESLISGAVERVAKSKIFTMYDKFGIPSKVSSERASMMLQDRNPKTGERTFFSKPPKTAPKTVILDLDDTAAIDTLIASKEPVLLGGNCPTCGKPIAENPHMVQPARIKDHEDAMWRVYTMTFPHMFKRHRFDIPRHFRDKELRDSLLGFVR